MISTVAAGSSIQIIVQKVEMIQKLVLFKTGQFALMLAKRPHKEKLVFWGTFMCLIVML